MEVGEVVKIKSVQYKVVSPISTVKAMALVSRSSMGVDSVCVARETPRGWLKNNFEDSGDKTLLSM